MKTTIKYDGRTYRVPMEKVDALMRRLRRASEGHPRRRGKSRSTRGPDRRSLLETTWPVDMGRCPARINGRV